jgi:hypothetical protein
MGPQNLKFRILNSFLLKVTDMKFHQDWLSPSKVIQGKRSDGRRTDGRRTDDGRTPSTIHIRAGAEFFHIKIYTFLLASQVRFAHLLRSQWDKHLTYNFRQIYSQKTKAFSSLMIFTLSVVILLSGCMSGGIAWML